MRTVGHRVEPTLSAIASGEALKAAAEFNEMMQRTMPLGKVGYIPKGVYRFKTHAEANAHQDECLVKHMARIEMEMSRRCDPAGRVADDRVNLIA